MCAPFFVAFVFVLCLFNSCNAFVKPVEPYLEFFPYYYEQLAMDVDFAACVLYAGDTTGPFGCSSGLSPSTALAPLVRLRSGSNSSNSSSSAHDLPLNDILAGSTPRAVTAAYADLFAPVGAVSDSDTTSLPPISCTSTSRTPTVFEQLMASPRVRAVVVERNPAEPTMARAFSPVGVTPWAAYLSSRGTSTGPNAMPLEWNPCGAGTFVRDNATAAGAAGAAYSALPVAMVLVTKPTAISAIRDRARRNVAVAGSDAGLDRATTAGRFVLEVETPMRMTPATWPPGTTTAGGRSSALRQSASTAAEGRTSDESVAVRAVAAAKGLLGALGDDHRLVGLGMGLPLAAGRGALLRHGDALAGERGTAAEGSDEDGSTRRRHAWGTEAPATSPSDAMADAAGSAADGTLAADALHPQHRVGQVRGGLSSFGWLSADDVRTRRSRAAGGMGRREAIVVAVRADAPQLFYDSTAAPRSAAAGVAVVLAAYDAFAKGDLLHKLQDATGGAAAAPVRDVIFAVTNGDALSLAGSYGLAASFSAEGSSTPSVTPTVTPLRKSSNCPRPCAGTYIVVPGGRLAAACPALGDGCVCPSRFGPHLGDHFYRGDVVAVVAVDQPLGTLIENESPPTYAHVWLPEGRPTARPRGDVSPPSWRGVAWWCTVWWV
eukprot:TRINITY_DN3374_c0_g1_i1.p1 TRINITY_DN3374_c0_g1~~TRINITY_DN3374_c0_g1_i1.p1  ORF type:complete len:661 (-),score=92.88 TRINITY_DN3374_c0_g1_i1:234-2216(-)